MDKFKRVLAMIGVILLVFMYVMTIITAIFASDGSRNWFIGSIMMTVLVPMVLYAINMLAGLQKKTEANNRMREQIYMNQIRDALKQREAQENAAGQQETQANTAGQEKTS